MLSPGFVIACKHVTCTLSDKKTDENIRYFTKMWGLICYLLSFVTSRALYVTKKN